MKPHLSMVEANPFHDPVRTGSAPAPKRRRKHRPSLFVGWWFCDGRRLRRATRQELAEAYRLWATHSDIREGRVA